MRIKTTMFALPIVGLVVGALMQPVGAQTYYTKTFTSCEGPNRIERIETNPVLIEKPVMIEGIQEPATIDRMVTIERPVVIESQPPLVDDPPLILERTHSFHMGLPLGDIDVF